MLHINILLPKEVPLLWLIRKVSNDGEPLATPSLHQSSSRATATRRCHAHLNKTIFHSLNRLLLQLYSAAAKGCRRTLLEAVWTDLFATQHKLSDALAIHTAATLATECKKYTTSPRGKTYQETTGPDKHLMRQPVCSLLWQFQERFSYNDVHTGAQHLLCAARIIVHVACTITPSTPSTLYNGC